MFLVALLSSSMLVAQEPLQWTFPIDQSLCYEIVQTSDIEVDAGEAGRFSTHAQQTLDVVWRFDSISEHGSGEGAQQIERLRLKVAMPDGLDLEYDTHDDASPSGLAAMLTPLYEALVEEQVPITVAANGELVRFEPSEELTGRLTGVPATRAMSELVAGAALRRITELIAFRLPDSEQSARELSFDNRVLGKVTGKLSWQPPAASETDAALSKFKPQLTLSIESAPVPEADAPQPQPLAEPRIESQQVEGEATFNREQGRLEQLKLKIDLVIRGTITGGAVTSKLTQTITVRVVPAEN